MPTFTLGEIAAQIGAELKGGEASSAISSLAPLSEASDQQLSFLGDPKYQKFLPSTQALAVILTAEMAPACPTACLIVSEPAKAFALVATAFARQVNQSVGCHPSAVVATTASIDASVSLGPNVVIGEHVTIGANTQILPNTVIGDDVTIGCNCIIHPNVTIYAGTRIGDRVIIHSGAAIGSDGFGNVSSQGQWSRMPQLGHTLIGDDVDIGANTTIDCGALGDTVIGNGVKLDNQIQIAHNVKIGDHTAMAAQVGIAGSTKIGKHCMLGGKVGVVGHIELCDRTFITASSNILRTVLEPGVYASHFPVDQQKAWNKKLATFNLLPALHKKIKMIEKALILSGKNEESS